MGFRAVGECGWEECVSGMVDTLVAVVLTGVCLCVGGLVGGWWVGGVGWRGEVGMRVGGG